LWQAFDRLETLEHTAKIAILAHTLGGANDLPPDAIKKLVTMREKAVICRKKLAVNRALSGRRGIAARDTKEI
jgi:ribulose-5-phosphate 4-epimerase/fuculose-1-phosphate aldolase